MFIKIWKLLIIGPINWIDWQNNYYVRKHFAVQFITGNSSAFDLETARLRYFVYQTL